MDWIKKIPIGQYVSPNKSWLGIIDPRLKMIWVMMFLLTPILAGSYWRIGLVLGLIVVTSFSRLPLRVWWRPLILVLILALILGSLAMFLPTGITGDSLSIRPVNELPDAIVTGPPWDVVAIGPFHINSMSLGPVVINRRSIQLGINTSTLIFTVAHSVNLLILTTPPENLIWALQWFLSPLAIFGISIDRISFQLLLTLRFIPLVQEEFQNLLRSLSTRAVNLRDLGLKASLALFLSVGERLLANILLRAEQGAESFLSRGGVILPSIEFRPKAVITSRTILLNMTSTFLLLFVLSLRWKYGGM
mgnify:FL=1